MNRWFKLCIGLRGWLTGRGSARACRAWCSASTIVVAVATAASPASAAGADLSDLAYGSDPQQVLDLHLPPSSHHAAPVLVFFHGGAFVGGDKHPCAPRLATLLTARGIAFACANYRLAPRVHYPVPMRDGARAVQWLRAHAADYHLDTAHFAVMGMSAGAGIALWIAFRPDLADPGSVDPVLRQSTSISAAVTGNAQATYDPAEIEARLHTRQVPDFLAKLFGAPSVTALGETRFAQAEHDASPTANMHTGEPPLLAYYAAAPTPLPPDSSPQAYLHHPEQGALLQATARRQGADLILRNVSDYPQGWQGFLSEAADFINANFNR